MLKSRSSVDRDEIGVTVVRNDDFRAHFPSFDVKPIVALMRLTPRLELSSFCDFEADEVAGVGRVRSAADLLAEVAHGIDRDAFPVFVAEETDCSAFPGILQTHFLADDRIFFLDDFIHQPFHFGDLFRRHLSGWEKSEAEAFGVDVGSLLGDMVPEDDSQRLVQQMGRRVETGGFRGMIRKSALEFLFRAFAGERPDVCGRPPHSLSGRR